jgi:hypothetical protein
VSPPLTVPICHISYTSLNIAAPNCIGTTHVSATEAAFATFSFQNAVVDQKLLCSLAYADLFTTFAYVFRKFDLQHGTTEHDMDWHDCYTPGTFGHLNVTVKTVSV